MKTIRTSLPGHLIDAYWQEVEEILVRDHQVSAANARKGIRKYRRALARHGVGDIQYHAGAANTAQGVKTGGYTD